MDYKTETKLRQELAEVWQMLDAERAGTAAAVAAAVAAERERWRGLLQEALDADDGDYVFGEDLADRMRAALRA